MKPERALKPTPFPGALRSPCVSICRMDVASGYCEGCYRTIEEIADWGMMSDDRKREVWQALRQRQAALYPPMPAEVDERAGQPAGEGADKRAGAAARVMPTAAPPVDPLPDSNPDPTLQPRPQPTPDRQLTPLAENPRRPTTTGLPLIGPEPPPDAG